MWHGRVATTFYHSSSGGRTSSNAEAWPGSPAVPYLASVADPYGWRSKWNRWGPFPLKPDELGGRLGAWSPRPRRHPRPVGPGHRGDDQGPQRCPPDLPDGFRRALDLRSTWFSVRVLHLEGGPRARGSAGDRVAAGFVRGFGQVRLEQQVNGGTWTTVARPSAGERPLHGRRAPTRTASYRLATPVAAGAAVTVKAR